MTRKERIEKTLTQEFSPNELVVEDFSHQHSRGAESHFDVYIIAEAFNGRSVVQKHRLIYVVLKEELESGLHALKIQAFGSLEKPAEKSTAPRCAGGSP